MKQLITYLISSVCCLIFDYSLLQIVFKLIESDGDWLWALLLFFIISPPMPVTFVEEEEEDE